MQCRCLTFRTNRWFALRLGEPDNTASQISQGQTEKMYPNRSQLFMLLPEHPGVGVGVVDVCSKHLMDRGKELKSFTHPLFMWSRMTIRKLGNHTEVAHSSPVSRREAVCALFYNAECPCLFVCLHSFFMRCREIWTTSPDCRFGRVRWSVSGKAAWRVCLNASGVARWLYLWAGTRLCQEDGGKKQNVWCLH